MPDPAYLAERPRDVEMLIQDQHDTLAEQAANSRNRPQPPSATADWQIPVVCTGSPAAAGALGVSHHSGPGKYG